MSRITPISRTCKDCGSDFRPNHNTQVRCWSCGVSGEYAKARGRAHSFVYRAVRKGELVDLSLRETACVDCGAVATDYDHRDYSKPLDVAPVCRRCNRARGEAKYSHTPEQADAA